MKVETLKQDIDEIVETGKLKRYDEKNGNGTTTLVTEETISEVVDNNETR